jgi:co-chaperonin GroES (HSP10)
MYNFTPLNKLLLVKKVEEKKQTHSFYVPETYTAKTHTVVELVRASEGSHFQQYEGSNIVVQAALIEQISIEEDKFLVVSESGVQGILRKNEL